MSNDIIFKRYNYSLIIQYNINKTSYKSGLKLSEHALKVFQNKPLFIYYAALNAFQIAIKTKESKFNRCKSYFERYIELQKNLEQTHQHVLNSYYYLARIYLKKYEKENKEELISKAINLFDKILSTTILIIDSKELLETSY